jgi:hypothetical protein
VTRAGSLARGLDVARGVRSATVFDAWLWCTQAAYRRDLDDEKRGSNAEKSLLRALSVPLDANACARGHLGIRFRLDERPFSPDAARSGRLGRGRRPSTVTERRTPMQARRKNPATIVTDARGPPRALGKTLAGSTNPGKTRTPITTTAFQTSSGSTPRATTTRPAARSSCSMPAPDFVPHAPARVSTCPCGASLPRRSYPGMIRSRANGGRILP